MKKKKTKKIKKTAKKQKKIFKKNKKRKIKKNKKAKKRKIKKRKIKKSKKIKRNYFNLNKAQTEIKFLFKNLTIKKVASKIFQPLINIYEDFKQEQKIKKIQKINLEIKEKARELKEQEKLRKQIKYRELKDEIRIAKVRSMDLKNFLKKEQALIRAEQKQKERKFLEEIKLEKKIELFRKRELQEIKNLEKLSLKEERADYRPLQERLEKIKEKYRLLREEKVRQRVETLGLEISDSDTKEDLLSKEKEYLEHRKQIELVLESFYRSANSLIFQLNKKYIPKHKSILRIIDRRYETNECFVRYDDSPDEDWLLLIYLEDSNPKKGKIVVENKTNPEKHETKQFRTKEIFAFSDYLVDIMTSHIDRERQKKAS